MAASGLSVSAAAGGLSVIAYPGDNMVLLAFSLEEAALTRHAGLAGFAITRTPRGGQATPLENRLTFTRPVTAATAIPWTSSVEAPFQKFRWLDVPPDGLATTITYRVTARYFARVGANDLIDGPSVEVQVDPVDRMGWRFLLNFTRGYLASQAYAEKFDNKPIRPAGAKTIDFDPAPFAAQWAWLGADAGKAVYDFLAECLADPGAKLDVFAYDLDEPHIIDALCTLGRQGRLRAVLDNADLHTRPDRQGVFPPEVAAKAAITEAAGAANVVTGHFHRYAHDKVFIKRGANGQAQKVLTGSANFSIRGLYVQANSVIVIDDPEVADIYAEAFETALEGQVQFSAFAGEPIAQKWFDIPAGNGLPAFSVSFAPHRDPSLSLDPVAARMQAAHSSVLFAVMDITAGGGPVLDDLRKLAAKPTIFSYGTVQSTHGLQLQKPDGALAEVAEFSTLRNEVPEPFRAEWDGGPGRTIHHKFVVVDFNGDDPVVYCGSSNLAKGGEGANGDNLLAIHDSAVATMYAVEAIRLFDHYHFRSDRAAATQAKPLTLQGQGDPQPWWQPYYDTRNIKLRDRCLFAKIPLPAGVATIKAGSAPAQAPAAAMAPPPKEVAKPAAAPVRIEEPPAKPAARPAPKPKKKVAKPAAKGKPAKAVAKPKKAAKPARVAAKKKAAPTVKAAAKKTVAAAKVKAKKQAARPAAKAAAKRKAAAPARPVKKAAPPARAKKAAAASKVKAKKQAARPAAKAAAKKARPAPARTASKAKKAVKPATRASAPKKKTALARKGGRK